MVGKITIGSGKIARLRMFTYEPSYLATLLVPFIVFSFSNFIFHRNKKQFFIFILALFPMLFIFSLGVSASLFVAMSIVSLFRIRMLSNRRPIFFIGLILIVSFSIYVVIATENILSLRINNVIDGVDSSGNVRIKGAFYAANKIVNSTDLWWGAGFGQSKLFLPKFYNIKWITNVVADTFASFGLMGLILRFGAEVFLFFKTQVNSSYFRSILFLFAFIYQFTGSYLSNLTEYIIWLLAFFPVFMEFEKRKDTRWILVKSTVK